MLTSKVKEANDEDGEGLNVEDNTKLHMLLRSISGKGNDIFKDIKLNYNSNKTRLHSKSIKIMLDRCLY